MQAGHPHCQQEDAAIGLVKSIKRAREKAQETGTCLIVDILALDGFPLSSAEGMCLYQVLGGVAPAFPHHGGPLAVESCSSSTTHQQAVSMDWPSWLATG